MKNIHIFHFSNIYIFKLLTLIQYKNTFLNYRTHFSAAGLMTHNDTHFFTACCFKNPIIAELSTAMKYYLK